MVTGVVIPLIGVLFGYTAIYLKVSRVKQQLRLHRQRHRVLLAQSKLTDHQADDAANQHALDAEKKHFERPGFTSDDVKLAKTLFLAFATFAISW